MTDYLALFRTLYAEESAHANSAISANSPSAAPNGTNGTNGTGVETPIRAVTIPSRELRQDDYEERAALATHEAEVPREWAEGFATLQTAQPPVSISEARWQQIIDDAGRFLDGWATKASALEWTTLDVFGVHPSAPEARHDGKGLVLLIAGGEVLAITAETARLRRGHGLQTYRRMPMPCSVALWRLV